MGVSDLLEKGGKCFAGDSGDISVGFRERRDEPREAARDVVHDADLSITVVTRADSDRWDGEPVRDLRGDIRDDAFEDHGEDPGRLQCQRRIDQAPGLALAATFLFVSTLLANPLR